MDFHSWQAEGTTKSPVELISVCMWTYTGDKILQVCGSQSMKGFICKKDQFKLSPGANWKPKKPQRNATDSLNWSSKKYSLTAEYKIDT